MIGRRWVGITSTSWSSDGNLIACGSDAGSICIWNVKKRELLEEFFVSSTAISSLSWLSLESSLTYGTHAGGVFSWEARTKKPSQIVEANGPIGCICWSPDEQALAIGVLDGSIQIFNIKTRKLQKLPRGHNAPISALAWSPSSHALASGAENGTIRVGDVPSRQRRLNLQGHRSPIRGLAWSPDGLTIASGAENGQIHLWNTETGESTQGRKTNGVRSLAWSPDGQSLATAASDGSMRFWDATTLQIRRRPRGNGIVLNALAYSPNGKLLASGSSDDELKLWSPRTGKLLQTLRKNAYTASSMSLSRDKKLLASGASDGKIRVWDAETNALLNTIEVHSGPVPHLSWSPDGRKLAASRNDGFVRILERTPENNFGSAGEFWAAPDSPLAWSPDSTILAGSSVYQLKLFNLEKKRTSVKRNRHTITAAMAWSPGGALIAEGSDDGVITLWDTKIDTRLAELRTAQPSTVASLAWSNDGRTLISGEADGVINVWDAEKYGTVQTLEGHSSSIRCFAWSADDKKLASVSDDGRMLIWDTSSWSLLENLAPQDPKLRTFDLFFYPETPTLTILGDSEAFITSRDMNVNEAPDRQSPESLQYSSAKIVLVGESNVGKSCLALRLTQDRYQEQISTHGMQVWPMTPDQLDPDAITPAGQKREILLWDMGGQDEYRLVHQLFLHDTTLALILLDPTRERTAFEDVESWNLRLEKQLHGRKTMKFLVGTKLDDGDKVTIDPGLRQLLKRCGIADYYPTSSKTGRGFPELRKAIAEDLDWDSAARISRTTIFQLIREEITRRQMNGEIAVNCSVIEEHIRAQTTDGYDPEAVNAVVKQLAIQGMIVDTNLTNAGRVLILQVSEIERYAGSLIIAARLNPRGVPAIEEQMLSSQAMTFPKIPNERRLPRLNELIVLECVTELLLEHGICLRHEGLLIFPSLFQAAPDNSDSMHHSISLYYDFSGAIDNIYSSLVVKLAISERFGRVRLWEDRAEYEVADQGLCGLRKVRQRMGLAHLDLYFSEDTSKETRDLFTVVIEEHLQKEGIRITEVLDVICRCGYRFQESSLRKRFAEGYSDIICPECETRSRISEGAASARENSPSVALELVGLKTVIENRSKGLVFEAKQAFEGSARVPNASDPIRILHVSDLHIPHDCDVTALVQPLLQDIEDQSGGLGFSKLDYLIVSGDLTNRASAHEFEQAYQFISEIISNFSLTAERCVIVPGNHDLSWDCPVYEWKQRRLVEIEKLNAADFHSQGDGFLIRNDKLYGSRFDNFAKFYHSLLQEEYPLKPEEQSISTLFDSTRIQFLGLNSSWFIDEFFPNRSGINPGALSRALAKADDQLKKARESGLLPGNAKVLRIAVWHHPVTGNDKIQSDAFLNLLRQAEFRVCLHGHIHEDRADVFRYLDPQKVHIVGAGSFGAPMKDRPESVPRLYNVLEVDRDFTKLRINTRSLRKEGGAWEGWAVWPGASSDQRLTHYDIKLEL
jgi:small GTP-binding protein